MSLADWYEKRKREDPEWAATIEADLDARIAAFDLDTFDADFNETDDAGRVGVLVPDDKSMPELGAAVHLYDADENYCLGTVEEVAGRVAYVDPHWDTWWPGSPVPRVECPDRDRHRPPEGPNEDMGLCRYCRSPTFEMRLEGETYGDHWPDCSLPIRHERECVGGGAGHPQAAKIRGYWPGQFGEPTVAEARRMRERGEE